MPMISTEFETGVGFNDFGRMDSAFAKKSLDEKTVFWYCAQNDGYQYQFNTLGYTYYFMALG